MKLYDIDNEIMECLDMETGEILDEARLNELTLEREKKLENVALWYKNVCAEVDAYKKEKAYFADKQARAEKQAEGLKNYLSVALAGVPFNTTRVKISYRTSVSVDITDIEKIGKDFIKYEPKADKKAIKEAMKSGEIIDGACLVEKQNIQIK